MSIFCAIRVYNAICNLINWVLGPSPITKNVSYYLLSEEFDDDDLDMMKRVPEDSIFIEDWEDNGVKKSILFYEGEEIRRRAVDPFEKVPEVPWIWIGDKKTEVDLTAALQKYMVVGNVILIDLIIQLIQVHHDTEIVYIDARTLEEVKFPNGGVRIVEKDVKNSTPE
jgi:hypothetical protein